MTLAEGKIGNTYQVLKLRWKKIQNGVWKLLVLQRGQRFWC